MRTHSASSRANGREVSAATVAGTDTSGGSDTAGDGNTVEPYWLPWHIDPNTISTLTGDEFFDFPTASTVKLPIYPDTGLGLLAMNALGDVVHLSQHIDDSSLVVMMAAGAQVHTGGLLRGCMHSVKRVAAPPTVSRIMYYQAWYGPSAHQYAPPNGSDYHPSRTTAPLAADERGRRVRSVVDPIVNSVYGRTQRTMLHDFRRQFQRLPSGNERDGSQDHFEALSAALPPLGTPPSSPRLTLDMMTDLSCPLAYLGLQRLRAAMALLSLHPGVDVQLRFHPVLINPHMAADGEDIGSYMRRRRNLSLEEYNDEAYPLNVAARQLNYSYAKARRVIHPLRAHALVAAYPTLPYPTLVAASGEEGVQDARRAEVYEALARRYFEDGDDIGRTDVLLEAAADLGMISDLGLTAGKDEGAMRRLLERAEPRVMGRYQRLDALVDGVPHFLLREGVYGSGLELHGALEVDAFVHALRRVDDARTNPPYGDGYGLQQPAGMVLPGYGGRPTLVPTVDRLGGPSVSAINLDGWRGPAAWPYDGASDFGRIDEAEDTAKYSAPNFGNHVDAPARAALTATYAAFFASAPAAHGDDRNGAEAADKEEGADASRGHLDLLDLASSWNSHYPPLPHTARVSVHGLSAEELAANTIARRRDVVDLNDRPVLPYANASFDFVTMAASVAYLTKPLEVFGEMHRVLRSGGVAIVSFSNRVFEEKATKVWLRHLDEEVALCSVVRAYFYFGPRAGWANVSSADVSPHPTQGDPMWIVTAVKP